MVSPKINTTKKAIIIVKVVLKATLFICDFVMFTLRRESAIALIPIGSKIAKNVIDC